MTKKRDLIDRVIIKSSEMVAAEWDDMTLKEMQLLLLVVDQISEYSFKMNDTIRVTIPKILMDDTFGLNNMTGAALKKLANQLQTRKITIRPRQIPAGESLDNGANLDLFADRDDNQPWETMVMVPTCRFSGGKGGSFTISLNNDLNSHFLDLHNRVKYKLTSVRRLSSMYHIRMYEMLMIGEENDEYILDIPLNRFKESIGAKGKYPSFNDFRRSVIETGVESINEHTDIEVSFEPIRSFRTTVSGLRFFVKKISGARYIGKIALAANPDGDAIGQVGSVIDADLNEIDRPNLLSMMSVAGMDEKSSSDALKLLVSEFSGKPNAKVADALSDRLQAAQEYIERLRDAKRRVFVQATLKKAVIEGWSPSERPEVNNRTAYEGSVVKEPKAEIGVDYEQVVMSIEASAELMDGFTQFISRPVNHVAIDILGKRGVRDPGLKPEIQAFGIKFNIGV